MTLDNPVNDNHEPIVFLITGRAHRTREDQGIEIHVLLVAPDEDGAVRETLNALAQEGYEQAELDQIGAVDEMPDEEPHASAYQGALEGEVAVITFDE